MPRRRKRGCTREFPKFSTHRYGVHSDADRPVLHHTCISSLQSHLTPTVRTRRHHDNHCRSNINYVSRDLLPRDHLSCGHLSRVQ